LKKPIVLTLLLFVIAPVFGQIQLSRVTLDGVKLKNTPRVSWRIPYYDEVKKLNKYGTILLLGGVALKNEGVIFTRDNDRYKYRTLALGADLSVRFVIKKKIWLSLAGGIDYNFHFKEKVFLEGERKNKEVILQDWFSERANRFNYFSRLTVGYKRKILVYSVFAEYYFLNFLNTNFSETKDGALVEPYKGFNISRFNIGITIEAPQEKKRHKRNVPSEKGF